MLEMLGLSIFLKLKIGKFNHNLIILYLILKKIKMNLSYTKKYQEGDKEVGITHIQLFFI